MNARGGWACVQIRGFLRRGAGESGGEENLYRRHSGLRTISGGICCGGRLRLPIRMQLRPLGYQRSVKSLVFRRNPSFRSLLNISIFRRPWHIVADRHPPPIG